MFRLRERPEFLVEKLYAPCYWKKRLSSGSLKTASVDQFPTAPLSHRWASVVKLGVMVEVQSSTTTSPPDEITYWLATVVEAEGYFVRLRYLGCDDRFDDFWMNITSMIGVVGGVDYTVHPVGWAADNNKELYPPKILEYARDDWKTYLEEKLQGCVTIPRVFHQVFHLETTSKFRPGMRLEAVDIRETGCIRVGFVTRVVGRRLEVVYQENKNLIKDEDQRFWFHESSHMLRPIGWAKLHGHAIRSTQEHYDTCLERNLPKSYTDDEAPLECFTALSVPENRIQHLDMEEVEVGMKLEFLAPQYPNMMSIGTIRRILHNCYVVIEADDGSPDAASNRMCVHITSNLLYHAGYAQRVEIRLRKPPGYENRPFKWKEYLEETESLAAPAHIFKKEIPRHHFQMNQPLEAVDRLASEKICVARVERVVNRLLLIHFDGFPCAYDQWVDMESPDIYPIGWCHSVGYRLSEPGEG